QHDLLASPVEETIVESGTSNRTDSSIRYQAQYERWHFRSEYQSVRPPSLEETLVCRDRHCHCAVEERNHSPSACQNERYTVEQFPRFECDKVEVSFSHLLILPVN
ncbi:hypothetical protein PENTCL1PPCAC_19647, partial [Pristionchus entomophagus]